MSNTPVESVPAPVVTSSALPGAVGAGYVGSHCRACGFNNFPALAVCPGCMSLAVEPLPLSTHGTLYSFSSLGLGDAKVWVGYVDLPEQVRVFARLETMAAGDAPRCGMAVDFRSAEVVEQGPRFCFALQTSRAA